jgi:hypothetical protein
MGILNRPTDGQLAALLALARTLQAYGPMAEDRLEAFCAPASVMRNAGTQATQVHKTLTRWKQLGLFLEEPSGEAARLRLAAPFDRIDIADVEAMRSPLRSLVLDARNNPLDDRIDDEESGDASDFSLAVAWVLQQDPYAFRAHWADVQILQNGQGVSPKFMSNSTRWDGLAEWAPFLGLGRLDANSALMPNPVHAVRAALPEIFTGTTVLPAREFAAALAVRLPILDRGAYGQAAARRVTTPWLTLDPTDLSPCLSLALLQLDRERRLQFERRSDAREVFRLLGRGGREHRQITHVALVSDPTPTGARV